MLAASTKQMAHMIVDTGISFYSSGLEEHLADVFHVLIPSYNLLKEEKGNFFKKDTWALSL